MKSLPILILALTVYCAGQDASPDPAEHAWRIITEGLKDSNPDKRKEVVNAASLGIRNEKTYSLLGDAMRDADVQVRLAACNTLSSWRDKRSVPLLKGALNDDVPEVGLCAAQGLWQLGDAEAKGVLLSILAGETKTSSSYLSKEKRQALRMFKTPGVLLRTITGFGIGFAPVPGLGTGFSSLRGLMKNKQVTGRALAALELAQDNDPQTLSALRDALRDKEWSVRAAAVHALAIRNQVNALEDIIPLMDDKKDAVRFRAAFAYLRLFAHGR